MKKAKNWNQPCPNTTCAYYGQKDQGNIRSIASYMTQSGKRRIFECTTCGEQFSETRDTVFFDLRTPEEKVMMALKMIEEINAGLLIDLPVTEVQLDEMWAFVQRKVSAHAADGERESPQDADDGRQWVWLSYAPKFRLILAAVVGPRTSETGLTLIQKTARRVSGIPAFFSDGFSAYLQALIDCYHTLKTFPRTGKPGSPKNPVKEPSPDLVYGQIVKTKRKGRLKEITTRVLCGVERFAELGLTISTTLLERLKLTVRQSLAPLVRKTLSFSKEREHLEQQVFFYQAFYNVARPHMSLREDINAQAREFEPRWRQRTPAMAAGLTDHIWTFRELLKVKFAHVP